MAERNDRLGKERSARGLRPGILAAFLGLGAALAGCGADPSEPVARLTTSPTEVELAYPGSAHVSAEWRMTTPLAPNPGGAAEGARLFVHLLDAGGSMVRTFDHDLPFIWRPGETVEAPIEIWQSALAPPLDPGDYDLTVGLYAPGDHDRWRLDVEAPEVDEGEYRVARVRVPPADPALGVEFSGGWQPSTAGVDLQVLARRWLVNDGSIELSGLPERARVEMAFRLPEAGEGVRLVLEDGHDEPRLVVSSPCAEEGASVGGGGEHIVAVLLRPGPDGSCRVRTDATFVALDLETLARRSVLLERLTWDPAGERGVP